MNQQHEAGLKEQQQTADNEDHDRDKAGEREHRFHSLYVRLATVGVATFRE